MCLGGNVFGRTSDERQSFEVLDAYLQAGGNFIDTADTYASGESEAIIGRWLRSRGVRERMVIATKVGMAADGHGLSASAIRSAIEGSLRRLQVERVDLYYAHRDDPSTSLHETLATFDELIREGKARFVAASNYSASRLADALETSRRESLASFAALQPHYNLVARDEYEGPLERLCEREGLPCVPYYALASGFLTGKYRPGDGPVASSRSARAGRYLDARGIAVLGALDEIAAAHETAVAAVALAWLLAKPTVAAPIASARTPEQLAELLPVATLELSPGEVERLDAASSWAVRRGGRGAPVVG